MSITLYLFLEFISMDVVLLIFKNIMWVSTLFILSAI